MSTLKPAQEFLQDGRPCEPRAVTMRRFLETRIRTNSIRCPFCYGQEQQLSINEITRPGGDREQAILCTGSRHPGETIVVSGELRGKTITPPQQQCCDE